MRNGGIVSSAILIPRYVVPHMRQTEVQARKARAVVGSGIPRFPPAFFELRWGSPKPCEAGRGSAVLKTRVPKVRRIPTTEPRNPDLENSGTSELRNSGTDSGTEISSSSR
jgi:hypothetical protein